MKAKHIVVAISYAGLQLPVAKSEDGIDITPLKPISDLFGLSWADQHKKIGANSPTCVGDIPYGSGYFSRRLGVCTAKLMAPDGQNREQICIRLDRVAAFLTSINPDKVRAQGNVSGADFLEAKIAEWDDALHDYEELGFAVNLNHAKAQEVLRRQRASFAQMIGVKNKTPDLADRRALGHVVKQMAGELGVPYQPDLTEGE
jgi:hypothetical protein